MEKSLFDVCSEKKMWLKNKEKNPLFNFKLLLGVPELSSPGVRVAKRVMTLRLEQISFPWLQSTFFDLNVL